MGEHHLNSTAITAAAVRRESTPVAGVILDADGKQATKALPEVSCGTCKWSCVTKEIVEAGMLTKARQCRRFPPTVTHFLVPPPRPNTPPGVMAHIDWANVPIDAWCGEHQPNNKQQQQ